MRQRRVAAPLGKVWLPFPLSGRSNLAFTMVSDSARAGDPWPAPSRGLLNLPSQACRLHDKKPSAFSNPATCQSAFALSDKNFLRVRPCLSRACVASGVPRSAQRAPPAPRGLNPQGRVPLCPHPVCPPDVRLACASACFILFAHVLFFPAAYPPALRALAAFPSHRGGVSGARVSRGAGGSVGDAWVGGPVCLAFIFSACLRSVSTVLRPTKCPCIFAGFSAQSPDPPGTLRFHACSINEVKNTLWTHVGPLACYCKAGSCCAGLLSFCCSLLSVVNRSCLAFRSALGLGWGDAVVAEPLHPRLHFQNPPPGLLLPPPFQH